MFLKLSNTQPELFKRSWDLSYQKNVIQNWPFPFKFLMLLLLKSIYRLLYNGRTELFIKLRRRTINKGSNVHS